VSCRLQGGFLNGLGKEGGEVVLIPEDLVYLAPLTERVVRGIEDERCTAV
jgi:hypothetical protein